MASTTMPVVLFTFCFVELALWTNGLSASTITGVPLPGAKETELSGEVFS